MAVIADAMPKDFLIAICALTDFRYHCQAPEISDDTHGVIDNALLEFHNHKHAIISAGKGNRVIDNWHIPKLEFLQSVSSNICDNGAPIQWSADATEQCHITEIKNPSHAGNNQGYESQICCFLDRAEKCQLFDLTIAISEAQANFNFPISNPDNDNNDNNDNEDNDNNSLLEDPEPPGDGLGHLMANCLANIQLTARPSGATR